MLANFMAPKTLTLRLDAQVMLIKNTDDMLVNGTMGKVVQFVDTATYEKAGEEILGGGKDGKKNITLKGITRYPVVEFILSNGYKRKVLVLPEVWKVELPNGEVQVSRTQVRRAILQNSRKFV
jgi:ATP-dependent DNA helicase PIF1